MGNGKLEGRTSDTVATATYSTVPQATDTVSLRVKMRMFDWTPGTTQTVGYSYVSRMYLNQLSGGRIQFWFWDSDPGAWRGFTPSAAPLNHVDGEFLWLRYDLDLDNDAGGSTCDFYTSSDDGDTWDLQQSVDVGAVIESSATLTGMRFGSNLTTFSIDHDLARVVYIVDGVTKLDADFSVLSQAEIAAGEFTEDGPDALTVTLGDSVVAPGAGGVMDRCVLKLQAKNYSGTGDWLDESGLGHDGTITSATPLAYDGAQHLYVPAVSGNLLSTPDSAAFDTMESNGDMDYQTLISLDDWTPAATAGIAQHVSSWKFQILATSGLPRFTIPAVADYVATAAPTVSDGDRLWIRYTRNATTGDIKFYTGGDGDTPSWSQLGTTVSGATGALPATTGNVHFANDSGGTLPQGGKVYRIRIYEDLTESSLVFDADLTDKTALTEPYATFTEKSANAATVTINRAASGYVSTVVDRAMFLFDGVNDVITVADHADLDMGTNVDFTVMIAARKDRTDANRHTLLHKGDLASQEYYLLRIDTNETLDFLQGPSSSRNATDGALSNNTLYTITGKRDADSEFTIFTDGVEGTPAAASGQDLSNTSALYIGARLNTSAENFLEGQVVAVAVWREALTDAQIESAHKALTLDFVPQMLLLGVG